MSQMWVFTCFEICNSLAATEKRKFTLILLKLNLDCLFNKTFILR